MALDGRERTFNDNYKTYISVAPFLGRRGMKNHEKRMEDFFFSMQDKEVFKPPRGERTRDEEKRGE